MSNLAMIAEQNDIRRKTAYVNAVVFEWCVRVEMMFSNPTLITNTVLQECALLSSKCIGLESFKADKNWVQSFREKYLKNLTQNISAEAWNSPEQSLEFSDIVYDLRNLFPEAKNSLETKENSQGIPKLVPNAPRQKVVQEILDDSFVLESEDEEAVKKQAPTLSALHRIDHEPEEIAVSSFKSDLPLKKHSGSRRALSEVNNRSAGESDMMKVKRQQENFKHSGKVLSYSARQNKLNQANEAAAARLSSPNNDKNKQLLSYKEALAYLDPLVDFAVSKENFQLINRLATTMDLLERSQFKEMKRKIKAKASMPTGAGNSTKRRKVE